ncbi:SDR family NAD(P)-dependent oxidoreductase [Leucobacter sp. Z1108]|uniref:SDR family NAD(P)-dependent oxidoreductase n=1 Tax=Leucobacter sp. Z1108 TaxID=3439066 RepID=UPI003F4121A2
MGRYDGKVVLISGIGAGMGKQAAKRFAEEGAKVVGCDLHAAALDGVVAEIRAEGGEISGFTVDAGDPQQVSQWIDDAVETYGAVDVLYNNAGWQAPFRTIDEMPIEDWQKNINLELNLVFYAVHYAWPHLKASRGVIINIGSIAGIRGVEFIPQNVHGAAKGGVINLTQQLAVEGGPFGIRAVCISPGFIETEATAFLVNDPPQPLKETWDRIPMRRVGRPDDIVNAALFLASDDASWITGVNLVVDGGGSVLG